MEDVWIVLWNGKPAGWPDPFKFKTRKEALVKAQKLGHQLAGSGDVVVTRESEYQKSKGPVV